MNSIKIGKYNGANMDIDLATPAESISWKQNDCPWNKQENSSTHKCAIKNISVCKYFCGIEYIDTVLCCYPEENPYKIN